MWPENEILREDMEQIAACPAVPWEKLRGKKILVTGATGLIGYSLVNALAYASLQKRLDLSIIALVRDEAKARERFAGALKEKVPLSFFVADLMKLPAPEKLPPADFILHGGSPTASRVFAARPVEVARVNIDSSLRLLELARLRKATFLLLSSMEVYGSLHREEKVTETHESFVDTMHPRSAYPEAKRMAETLAAAYASEYGAAAKVIRLTQTFGPGVRASDGRVFAQFARAALRGEPIVLLTRGGTRHSYLYTADAVTAILCVLLKGKNGEAYNAANEAAYCSIREMAETCAHLPVLAERFRGPVPVKVQISEESARIYPPELYMNLATDKIKALGWRPTRGLAEMFTRMMLGGL